MKTKLTVGFVIPQFPTLTETFFINQIVGLCHNGHRVIVFCSSVNEDKILNASFGLNMLHNLTILPFDFRRFMMAFMPVVVQKLFTKKSSFPETRRSIRKDLFQEICKFYFNRYRCDIYHFGYSGVALAFEDVLDDIKGKKVISCLGTAENVKTITEHGRINRLAAVFKKADAIHAVSYDMKNKIRDFDLPDSQIFINHPAVDTDYFTGQTLKTVSSTITVLSVGRLVFQKGYMIGLKAMELLKEKGLQFRWIIVGDGPDYEELAFNIDLLQLNNHVFLKGKKSQAEILRLYQDADIFFLPSITEGMANVVLEAMSMELPVVSSDCGGMPEVIKHNNNGMLCPNYDYNCMADTLARLCGDEPARRRLGTAARQTIVKDFNLHRYIHVFEKSYYQLLSS